MSRSKRPVSPVVQDATARLDGVFVGNDGSMRAPWRLVLALVSYGGVSVLVRVMANRGTTALFSAWNLRADNVWRAPRWAQFLFAWRGSLITLVVSAVLILLSQALRHRWPDLLVDRKAFQAKSATCSALCGALAALVSATVFLAVDSLRPAWPLTEPRWSLGSIALGVIALIATLSEELFTRAVIYEIVNQWLGHLPAALISAAVFFLLNGGYAGNGISALNVALMGLLCCSVYEKRGLSSSVGLRWGWSFATVFLLGFGGGEHAVYQLYSVSEAVFTGGDAGLIYGLWTTIMLLTALLWPAVGFLRGKRRADS